MKREIEIFEGLRGWTVEDVLKVGSSSEPAVELALSQGSKKRSLTVHYGFEFWSQRDVQVATDSEWEYLDVVGMFEDIGDYIRGWTPPVKVLAVEDVMKRRLGFTVEGGSKTWWVSLGKCRELPKPVLTQMATPEGRSAIAERLSGGYLPEGLED